MLASLESPSHRCNAVLLSSPSLQLPHFLSSHPLPHVARRVVPSHTRTHIGARRLIGTASPSQSQSTSVASRRLLLSLIGPLFLFFPCPTRPHLALAILPHFPPCRLPFSLKTKLSRKDSLLPMHRRSPPHYRLLPLPCLVLSPLVFRLQSRLLLRRVCLCLLYRSKWRYLLPPLHFPSSFTFSNFFSSIAHTIHRRLVPPVPEPRTTKHIATAASSFRDGVAANTRLMQASLLRRFGRLPPASLRENRRASSFLRLAVSFFFIRTR